MKKDKIKIFGERLKKVQEGIEVMKHYGLDEEILIAWLCHELKISVKKAKQITSCTQEFYDTLLKEQIVDSFKESENDD